MSHPAQVPEIQKLAALNNAAWCVAMWRAHGLEVERRHGLAACHGPAPRLYPNAVTIDPAADGAAQRQWLAELAADPAAGPGFSVKDSFQSLDLSADGYRRLFYAEWLRRPAGLPAPPPALDWRLVEDAVELAAWEAAWRGGAGGEGVGTSFPSLLLLDHGVGVLAGWDGEAIAAGCVLSPTGTVVGLSNVFGDYAEVVAAVAAGFSDRAMVGYERGDDLVTALDAGFQPVGGLTVWARG